MAWSRKQSTELEKLPLVTVLSGEVTSHNKLEAGEVGGPGTKGKRTDLRKTLSDKNQSDLIIDKKCKIRKRGV